MNPDRDSGFGKLERPQRIVDAKFPLTWLLGCAGTIILLALTTVWSTSSQNTRLEQLITTVTKLEARFDSLDGERRDMLQKYYEMKSIDDLQSQRLDQIERYLNLQAPRRGAP